MKRESMYVEGRPRGAAMSVADKGFRTTAVIKADIQTALANQDVVISELGKLVDELIILLSPVLLHQPRVDQLQQTTTPENTDSKIRAAIVTGTERLRSIISDVRELLEGLDLTK